ncbi:hypothetical protein PXJ20_32260 [Paraburkholderia sp. A1RI_3L]|uniref:hypothetical protein n=1 Tax=Paraburkholderia TaxID=1822464 RepID=UPI003B772798
MGTARDGKRPRVEGGAGATGLSGSEFLDGLLNLVTSFGAGTGGRPARLTRADAEHCMERFRMSVHLLLAHHLGDECGRVTSAYDVGIATGFYGWRSMITVGLRSQHEVRRARMEPGGLRAWLLYSGYRHGREIQAWANND